MTATKIDGTAIAKNIRERIHKEIEDTQKTNPRFKPSLKIIQGISVYLLKLEQLLTYVFIVGDRPDSSMFTIQDCLLSGD